MLYDPKWEVKTTADPLTLPALIAWLEQQPADKIYCYTDSGGCLLAQYFTAAGFQNVGVAGWGRWSHGEYRQQNKMPGDPVFHSIACREPRNFGAALERARVALR